MLIDSSRAPKARAKKNLKNLTTCRWECNVLYNAFLRCGHRKSNIAQIARTHERLVLARVPLRKTIRMPRERRRRERRKIGVLWPSNVKKHPKCSKTLKSLRTCRRENNVFYMLSDDVNTKKEHSANRTDSRTPCFCARSPQRLIGVLASAGGASKEKIGEFKYL